MAKCTPDTYNAIYKIAQAVAKNGGKLILSDLFRSRDMQWQSYQDYISGKKEAFSPPPGGSFHEAGRAFDLDLGALKMRLSEFWKIAAQFGVIPIIKEPKSTLDEAWHFDCRGSHQIVYQYYADKHGTNFKPYTAAAASAILSDGILVDAFGENQSEAALQSCLIRLGKNIGNLDGLIGRKTQKALEELGIEFEINAVSNMLIKAENLIQQKFPQEFQMPNG
ncbi:hypothetical protein FPE01S_03_01470 [Flavihumibacter petaseus NBRC 106054]|uniref:D-alanyl-D-alanine carboxypeptidase-like core domain-containing protein n=2 Tax=Flavihumibacter TaxID=1004301 RepID=A0A0E9N2V0_9BACT|nr:hypothetical protein FPE01S_03_01470 [Flavihumibacter petaseus NBRC 106054]